MEVKIEIDYGKYTITELLDIYSRVDKRFNEDKALAIEAELFNRAGMDKEAIEKELKSNVKSNVLGRRKRNTQLSVISWILLIYSGITLLSSIVGFFSFLFIGNIFQEYMSSQSLPPISVFFISNLWAMQIPSIIIASLFVYFGLGLLKLKESARESTVYLLWFSLVWNFVWGLFMLEFVSSHILNNTMAMMEMPAMSFFKASSYAALIMGQIIPSIVIGYFIYKLSSREIKREFEM